jgi:hypothetical protein
MVVDSPIRPFLGTWHGTGQGTLPGMPPFNYAEEIRFEDVGGDVAYFQRAWDPVSERTLHAEAGIWRVSGQGEVVASIAQARRNELSTGIIRKSRILLWSEATSSAGGIAPVKASSRSYWIKKGRWLTYTYSLAIGDMAEPQPHLAGTLTRQSIVK